MRHALTTHGDTVSRRLGLGYVLSRPITESPNANEYQKPIGLARAFDVVVLIGAGSYVPREISKHVQVVEAGAGCSVNSRFRTRPLKFVASVVRRLRSLSDTNRIDAVCTAVDETSLAIGYLANVLLGLPWMTFCWDHPCPVQAERTDILSRLLGNVRAGLLRHLVRRSSMLCCNIHPGLWREFGRMPVQTFSLPNGIDTERLAQASGAGPVDGRLIGVVGNVSEQKGAALAVDALHLVRKHFQNAKLRLIGETDPGFLPELTRRILSLGLDSAVEITEWRPYAAAMKLAAQCCIGVYAYKPLPRFYWNYVLKIGEYFALGKPVVCVDTPGAREYVKDGHNGFLVAPENPEAMASAICKLLGDPAMRQRMGRRAKLTAQQYSWGKIHDSMNEAIASALSRQT